MTTRSRWTLPLALLAALSLLFAACGDDDDTATEATDETPADEESETTDGADDGDEGEGDDGPDLEGADLGECGFFVEFAEAFEDVDPSELFATGEEIDFGSFFGPIAEQFQDVADAAPSDIEDAFHTVADGFSEVADQLDGVVIDLSDPQNIDPEALAALESMETSFETPEYEAAAEEIDAWMQENCADFADAIDLDSFGS